MDKIKNYVIGFLILVLLLTFSWVETSKKEYANLQDDLKIAQDSTHHYKNKLGETVAVTKVMKLDNSQLKSSLSLLGLDNKALKDQIGNLNKLVMAYQGKVGISGEIQTITKDSLVVVPGKDSIIYKDFDFKTKYIEFKGFHKKDTLFAKYKYTSPLLITLSETRKGIDAKASFEDPAARIDDQKVLFVQRKKKFYEKTWFKLGVGAVAGIYIDNKLK